MRLSNPPSQRTGCPIHIALELLGDRWTMLVVRDLLFKGLHTYTALIDAGEGIASNVLADRLQRLVGAGLVEKWPNPVDARQYEYHLTEAGFALAPMVVELILWSASHFETDAPRDVIRRMRRDRAAFIADARRGWAQRRRSAANGDNSHS